MLYMRDPTAISHPAISLWRFRMRRSRANQRQAELFDDLPPRESPSLLEVPADRGLELEAAVGELLLDAAGKIERGKGGENDA
jgi:hypothetical protein